MDMENNEKMKDNQEVEEVQDTLEEKEVEAQEVEEISEEPKEETEPVIEPMESIVEIQTTYDYRTLKFANMYVIKVKRKSFLVSAVMGGITLAMAILMFIFFEGVNRYLAIFIAALSVFTFYNMFTEEKKIDKTLVNYFKTHAKFSQVFLINDDKIRVTAFVDGKERCADYSWPYIQEINAIPEFYFLFLNGGSPLVLDRRPEAFLKGTVEDLEQIIKDKAELKPYKFYDKPIVKNLVEVTYYEAPIEDATFVDNIAEEVEDQEEVKTENKEDEK